MNGFINTVTKAIEVAQTPSNILAALAIIVGGYLFMWGGDEGRRKSKWWFIAAAVGLVIINGAVELANTVNSNIQF